MPSSSWTPSRSARSARSVERGAAERGAVGLRHLVARVREAVRELAVVRQQDQAGRLGVEAADRIEAALGGHEVDDGSAAVRVARGRDDAGRLVQRVDDARLGALDRLAVERDVAAWRRRRARGRARSRRRRSRGRRRSAARRRAARRRRRGRGTWRGALLPLYGRWTSSCSTARWRRMASPPSAPDRCGSGLARGATGYEEMTNLPAALAGRAGGRGAAVVADAGARGARVATGPSRRCSRRRDGRPVEAVLDALPRRAPLAVPLLAVRLPADVHLLRDRRDEVRPQPDRVGDPRPGAALPPHDRGRPLRLHGHGRADDEPRQRARRVLRGCRTWGSPRAARRSRRSAGSRGSCGWPTRRCRSGWRCRCTRPTTRCARRSCPSTTAIRWSRCWTRARSSTRPSAARSSSST